MRVKIPAFATKKELYDYLRDNERDLIEQKCATPIASEPFFFGAIPKENSTFEVKALSSETKAALKPDSIVVDAVANLSLWMDSHCDVSAPDSWKKSITERGKKMVWLADHSWSIKNKIAKVIDVYAQDMDVKAMGIKGSDIKTAQALIFQGEFNPKYDLQMFEKYSADMVDQHSIGLRYVLIELCINDPDDKTHFKNWEKYYPLLINKNKADGCGYFWWVKEQQIFENSAVLFGSNEMTPTISIQTAESLNAEEPHKALRTGKEPSNTMRWEHLYKIQM